MSANKVLSVLWDYFVMSVGTFLYVTAWTSFMTPHEVVSGGLTGLCAVIQLGTGIPISASFIVLNTILLLLGSWVLGSGFGIRTIYAIGFSTFLFWLMPHFPALESVPGNVMWVSEKWMIPAIGGFMEAVGIGMIFLKGGSTGGTDVIALIINKFFPISVGTLYLLQDTIIVSTVLLIPGKNLQDILYAFIAMITFSTVVDFILLGRKATVQVLIFSKKNDEIADYMIHNLNRGVTAIKSVGWYTKEDKNVLLLLIRKTELPDVTAAVKEIDNGAFMSVSQASSVFGEGFDEMKTGLPLKKNKNRGSLNQ